MGLYFYCFVCVVLCFLHRVEGEYAYVTIDPMLEGQGQCRLPSTVRFSVETESEALTLDLVRNDHVHPGVPAHIIQIGENGDCKFIMEKQTESKHHAAYQDPAHEAALFVSCQLNPRTGAQFEMEGTIFVKSIKYRLLPSNSPVPFYRRLFHARDEKLYHLLRAKEAVPFDSGIEAAQHEDILSNTMEEIRLPERPTRVKRGTVTQGPQTINIDVVVLLEYSVIKVWETREGSLAEGKTKAKEYFAHILNAVNLRYQRIENGEYKYNIRLVRFYIAETAADSPWSEDSKSSVDGILRTNASQVLTDLQQWVNSSRDQLEPYDHIMLFTSYDLVAIDNGFRFNYTTGFAYVGTMCNTKGYSISVVEDHGGFQSVGTAAHELGHSLGAKHDGSDNACRPADRYVMAPQSFNETEANKYNPWFFSICSVDSFVNYTNEAIADPTMGKCLTESLTPKADVPDVTAVQPGQLYAPDTQCTHQYGNKSYLCRGVGFDVGNILCRAMFCYQPSAKICLLMTAARGTTCGNRKWCIDGACVQSDVAPITDDTCPHGDQPYVITEQGEKSCRTVVSKTPGLCYNENWSSTCCTSCKQACDGPADCRCRDRQNGCVEADCGGYDAPTLTACCWTCRNFVPTTTTTPSTTTTTTPSTTTTSTTTPYPSTCTDVTQFEGVTCTEYVQNRGRHVCYTDRVNKSCCGACKNKIDNTTANCQWGDESPASCYPLKSLASGAICPKGLVTDKCCETCAKLLNAVNIPQPTGNQPTTNQAASVSAATSTAASIGVALYFLLKSSLVK